MRYICPVCEHGGADKKGKSPLCHICNYKVKMIPYYLWKKGKEMAWGNCGTDSKGRPIGYNFPATCDHPDCLESIHRGLSYVCGDMHGEDEYSCEKYFCEKHKNNIIKTSDGTLQLVCDECYKLFEEQEE